MEEGRVVGAGWCLTVEEEEMRVYLFVSGLLERETWMRGVLDIVEVVGGGDVKASRHCRFIICTREIEVPRSDFFFVIIVAGSARGKGLGSSYWKLGT